MSEDRFGRVAVELGLINDEQLDDVLAAMKQLEEMGLSERMGTIMVKKGYLTETQVKEVTSAQGAKSKQAIAGYEIVEKIGQGAMGAVYKARQVSMDRLIALKVLAPSLSKDRRFIDRFLTEARAAAQLNHPNIIQGIDVGKAGKYYYFAMEYVDGTTLTDRMKADGPVPEAEAVSITSQVAAALDTAARYGIVHRDIKPDNVMITTEGEAKLCDLGLAKRGKYRDPAAEGTTIGTPHYISPEQSRGEVDVDIRSDIYSLGATLYHMLTGQPPFEGPTAAVVMTKHLTEELTNPQDFRPELSDGVVHIIERMMAKDAGDRYQTPAGLLDDLEHMGEGKGPRSSRLAVGRSSVMRSAKRRVSGKVETPHGANAATTYYIVGAACAALLLAVVAVLAWPESDDMDPPLPPVPTPAPAPGPIVETPPAVPATVETTSDAEEMFLAAKKYADDSPGEFWGIVRRYEQVKAETTGTKFSLMATDELARHRRRQGEKRKTEFDARKARSAKLEGEDRFAEAMKAFEDFPKPLLEDDTPKAVYFLEKEKKRVDLAGRARFKLLEKEVKAKVSSGDLTGARESLACMKRIGLSMFFGKIPPLEKDIADAESAMAQAADAAKERAVRAKFSSTQLRVISLARGKKHSEAIEAADAALADLDLVKYRSRFGHLKRGIETVAKRLEEVVKVLEKRVVDGKPVTIHKRGVLYRDVKVISIDDGDITVKLRGMGNTSVKITDLSSKDIIDLTDVGTYSQTGRFEYGAMLFFENRIPQSKVQLTRAAEYGDDAATAKYLLSLIAWQAKADREAAAGALLSQARGHFAAKRWAEAKKALETLNRDYSDTDVYKDNRGEPGAKKKKK